MIRDRVMGDEWSDGVVRKGWVERERVDFGNGKGMGCVRPVP